MNFLIDTHIILWISSQHKNLGSKFKKKFQDENQNFFISVASIWEMAIKISLQKLILPVQLQEFVESEIINNGIQVLDIKPEHTYNLLSLPFHHRDPFDRIIISQAITEKMTLVTHDRQFKKYKAKIFSN